MSPANSKAIAAAEERFIHFAIQYCSIALVWYDYILTFRMERQYMWKTTWTSIPYYFTRYPLVGNVLYLLAIANILPYSCDNWYKFVAGLSVLGRGAVIYIFTMRTYGVYDKNKFVLAWLGLLGVTCIVLDTVDLPDRKCTTAVDIPGLSLTLSTLTCVFELSVACLIVVRAIRVRRDTRTAWKDGILVNLLQQGILYFCGVFALQLASVVFYFRPTDANLNALTLPISCLLAARFTLELREVDARMSGQISASILSTMRITDFDIPRVATDDLDRFSEGPSGGAMSRYLSNSTSEPQNAEGTA